MNGWIDIRLGGPKESDANLRGDVYWLFDGDRYEVFCWYGYKRRLFSQEPIAWMSIPEFHRAPDPPEGFEIFDAQPGEIAYGMMVFLKGRSNPWKLLDGDAVNPDPLPWVIYARPIDPPAPTYRPFKDAAEFDPFALKMWRLKTEAADTRRQPSDYNDRVHGGRSWKDSLDCKIFCDGTPFGVKVEG